MRVLICADTIQYNPHSDEILFSNPFVIHPIEGLNHNIVVGALWGNKNSITITQLTPEQMESPYPKFFDKEGATNNYVLIQLLLHLNYHLGQVNYLRECLNN